MVDYKALLQGIDSTFELIFQPTLPHLHYLHAVIGAQFAIFPNQLRNQYLVLKPLLRRDGPA